MDRRVDTELHNETSSDGQADSRRRRQERRGVEGDSLGAGLRLGLTEMKKI